jgi:sulfide:quinone oxidoreductase
MTGEVDSEKKVIRSYDEREVPYDLLVTIPPHTGTDFLEDSALGDELGFVPTDPYTLEAKGVERVFCMGDATDLPSSKAGSVAHFQADLLTENVLRAIEGKEAEPTFDGHSNCFVETGFGKAMLIDFNYDTEPLPGQFPIPVIGPLPLLKEARRNHWAKLAFQWIYWNGLLPARPIPISPTMSLAGKKLSAATETGGA